MRRTEQHDLAAYRELEPKRQEALRGSPQTGELLQRNEAQDELLATLAEPILSPAIVERIWKQTVDAPRRMGAMSHLGRRWSLVAAVVCLVLVLGVGRAAAESLPGDLLYGLKRAGEQLYLALPHSDTARQALIERRAERRRAEIRRLMAQEREGPAVEWSGVVEQAADGSWQISGVPVLLPAGATLTPGQAMQAGGRLGREGVQVSLLYPCTTPKPERPRGTDTPHPPASPSPTAGQRKREGQTTGTPGAIGTRERESQTTPTPRAPSPSSTSAPAYSPTPAATATHGQQGPGSPSSTPAQHRRQGPSPTAEPQRTARPTGSQPEATAEPNMPRPTAQPNAPQPAATAQPDTPRPAATAQPGNQPAPGPTSPGAPEEGGPEGSHQGPGGR